ncbi:winged helix-turn-helix transcriptional regulator [Rhodococcus sp. D2-41]|uniref:MarR family winged helix-turn-helix transcriptional regulator n=1 Tax=Speluncibacter jeojiensis TaxID=2710754 RepID=A0A9X4M0S7_9ACTN|nr:MarR family winged helix-turn-helix transcriptional regulator [Rhodococcus sp. D2-41]MDG3010470.1 winged helix-turn-helix transcriptional regulator [Rhodococcus sp. D2-41]MDG3014217.1 MarR family winged helix-turn-helix transcriptional regulator [Corynebacteriales bacterium D3-21]
MSSSPVKAPESLLSRPGYVLERAARMVRQLHAEGLAGVGLLPHQHAILCCLDEFGPDHQKAVAGRLRLDPGDIVAYLDGLETNGAITRERDARDRRRQIVSITDSGRATLAAAERALDNAEKQAFAALDGEARTALGELLERVYADLVARD